MKLLLFLSTAGVALASRQEDYPGRTLIEIKADFAQVFAALDERHTDRDDMEEIWEDRVKIWAHEGHMEDLVKAGLDFEPTVDTSEINFLEEKKKNYQHVKGAEPDWEQYCGYDCLRSRIDEWSSSCALPFKVELIGKSYDGRDIHMMQVGNSTGPEVGMWANIHGDETTGGQVLQRWIWQSCNNPTADQAEAAAKAQVWYMPMFNPDGFERNRRGNGANADLNRNFPYPTGSTPNPYSETTAHINKISKHNFRASLMMHGGAQVCNTAWDNCYTTAIVDRPCPPALHKTLSSQILASSKAFCDPASAAGLRCTVGSGCQTNGASWYQISGSLQDHEVDRHEVLSMTMELSSTKRPAGRNLPTYYGYSEKAIHSFIMWPVNNL